MAGPGPGGKQRTLLAFLTRTKDAAGPPPPPAPAPEPRQAAEGPVPTTAARPPPTNPAAPRTNNTNKRPAAAILPPPSTPQRRAKLQRALGEQAEDARKQAEVAERFEWLREARDGAGRARGHPEYDERTCQVPPARLKKMSNSQQQYWQTKARYRDVILFFKVGKFYELYEDDAEIGADELQVGSLGAAPHTPPSARVDVVVEDRVAGPDRPPFPRCAHAVEDDGDRGRALPAGGVPGERNRRGGGQAGGPRVQGGFSDPRLRRP